MFYKTFIPKSPLNRFVDYFWLFDGGQATRKERIVPSGTTELVINLCEDQIRIENEERPQPEVLSGATLSGPYSKMFVIDATQHECMLGVHFKPGGVFPFLNISAGELTNTHTDLVDLWGSDARELRDRLCASSTHQERFRIIEAFLAERLRFVSKLHASIDLALNVFGPYGNWMSVTDAAREAGMSQRQFTKVFGVQVGLSPKLFCRILRFQRARDLADRNERPQWAEIALDCGYYDQSHLINDFHEFSGMAPTEYSALRASLSDKRLKIYHVPLESSSVFSKTHTLV